MPNKPVMEKRLTANQKSALGYIDSADKLLYAIASQLYGMKNDTESGLFAMLKVDQAREVKERLEQIAVELNLDTKFVQNYGSSAIKQFEKAAKLL